MPAIEEELSFDIGPALANIDRIDAALQQVTTTFAVNLADALGVLNSVTVSDVDATAVTTGVEQAVTDGAAVAVVEDVDATAVASGVEEAVADGVAVPAEVPAPDTTAVTDAVDGAVADGVAGGVAEGAAEGAAAVSAFADSVRDELAAAASEGLGEGLTEAEGLAPVAGQTQATTAAVQQQTQAWDGLGFAIGAATGNYHLLIDAGKGLPVVGAAVAGVAAVTALLVDKADKAKQAEERLNLVFGDQADAVNEVNIGGLSGNLGDLAKKAGSSGAAMRQASADFAMFARGFDVSEPAIQTTIDQLQGLALRAAVLNPNLGDAGAAMSRLQGALITGRAKALAPFGIGLDKAAVSARALEIAMAAGRTEITQADKVMAGAQLATEKLGDALGEDFAKGAEQSTIRMRALSKEISGALAKAGKPLIEPIITIAEALVPIATTVATALGEVIESVVSLASGFVDKLAPAVDFLASAFDIIMIPIEGAAEVIDFLSGVLQWGAIAVGGLIVALGGLNLALEALAVVANINPLVLALTAVATVVGLVNRASQDAKKAREEEAAAIDTTADALWGEVAAQTQVADATDKTADATENLTKIRSAAVRTLAEFLAKSKASTVSDDAAAVEALGISYTTLARDLLTTGSAFTTLSQATGLSTDALEELGALASDKNLFSGGAYRDGLDEISEGLGELLPDLQKEAERLQAAGEARLTVLVASGQLTKAQRAEIEATNTLADGTVNYAAAAQRATTIVEKQQRAAEKAALQNSLLAGSWDDLTTKILAGSVSLEDAETIAAQLGVTTADVEAFFNAVTQSVVNTTDTIASALPTTADAFTTWQDGIAAAGAALEGLDGDTEAAKQAFDNLIAAADPARLTEALYAQTVAVINFGANLERLIDEGLPRIAELVTSQGAVVGGGFAQAILDSTPEQRQALEQMLGAYETTTTQIQNDLGPKLAAATGSAGEAGKQALAESLGGLPGVVTTATTETQTAAEEGKAGFVTGFLNAGLEAAAAFGANFTPEQNARQAAEATKQVLVDAERDVTAAATRLGEAAVTGLAQSLDDVQAVAKGSVNLVAAQFTAEAARLGNVVKLAGIGLGQAFDAGVVQGIADGAPAVAEAARVAVRAAIDAAKDEAGVQSPSKEFATLGGYLVDGLVNGLDDGTADASAAARRTATAVVDAAQSALDAAGQVEFGVRPVEVAFADAVSAIDRLVARLESLDDVRRSEVNVNVRADGSTTREAAITVGKVAARELQRRRVNASVRAV